MVARATESGPTSTRFAMICDGGSIVTSVAPILDLIALGRTITSELVSETGAALPMLHLTALRDAQADAPFAILPDVGIIDFDRDSRQFGVVILPASTVSPPPRAKLGPLVRWVARQHADGAHVAAIGSGVVLAAEAGVLDGATAVVPVGHEVRIIRDYPNVADAPFARTIIDNRVLTARDASDAGALAGLMARTLFSSFLTDRLDRTLHLTPSPDMRPASRPSSGDALVDDARDWIVRHLREDIRLEQVAAAMNIGKRTLSRRFQTAVGMTPSQFLRRSRIEFAMGLLRRTRYSVDQVANFAGYRDVSFFRTIFRDHIGLSPRAFRASRTILPGH